MNPSKFSRAWFVVLLVVTSTAFCQTPPDDQCRPGRTAVFISDLHFGVGRNAEGNWDPFEDFRWTRALGGFLDHVSSTYRDNVDLVILGDFFELWQPHEGMRCTSPTAGLGCTKDQAEELVGHAVKAHARDLALLTAFSQKNGNHLYIVPGNHDAALLLPNVWKRVGDALNAQQGVSRVDSGVWTSCDRKIVGEHGHQIGKDVNRFKDWPVVVAKHGDGSEYLIRSWGEQFVQKLFNDEEREYPIIDNLSPESAGARYRFADRGVAKTALDSVRFVAFNLFQTSIRQKAGVFGESNVVGADEWSAEYARSLGAALLAAGLPTDDPIGVRLSSRGDADADLRDAADEYIGSLDEPSLKQLCDHAAIRKGKVFCVQPVSGAATQALFNTKESVLKAHLRGRLLEYGRMKYFVYGHTHQFESPWDLRLSDSRSVEVANTGAFHRVIDEKQFAQLIKGKIDKSDALKQVTNEQLPACYSYVVAVPDGLEYKIQLRRWQQDESGDGKALSSGSPCAPPQI